MHEVIFYRLSELQIYGCYATEKQRHTPSKLPEIVYLLKLKGGTVFPELEQAKMYRICLENL